MHVWQGVKAERNRNAVNQVYYLSAAQPTPRFLCTSKCVRGTLGVLLSQTVLCALYCGDACARNFVAPSPQTRNRLTSRPFEPRSPRSRA
jgi:hypothetical protein